MKQLNKVVENKIKNTKKLPHTMPAPTYQIDATSDNRVHFTIFYYIFLVIY